tara:strand:+ start:13597 stop:14580 length:984 start_codon:yes stop_codon:yes gene_type:complete
MKQKKKSRKSRLKIGIALSGGAARGISHIGILKVLEKEKIPIDYIAGTSIGSLIGAFYASGIPINEIEKIMKTTKWRKLVDFTTPKTGFITGKKIENRIKEIVENKNFEDLDIPLSIVSTELNRGEKVIFKHGNLTKAIRASISIPGVFEPVIDKNSTYADGSMVDPIPVDVLKDMGADIIIAVDLTIDVKQTDLSELEKEESAFTEFFERKLISTQLKYLKNFLKEKRLVPYFLIKLLSPRRVLSLISGSEIPQIIKYMIRSYDILTNQLEKEKLKYSYVNIIIKPKFKGIKWTEFDKTDHCIKAGEKAAKIVIPKIRKLLYKRKN